jgi:hypothetical protein
MRTLLTLVAAAASFCFVGCAGDHQRTVGWVNVPVSMSEASSGQVSSGKITVTGRDTCGKEIVLQNAEWGITNKQNFPVAFGPFGAIAMSPQPVAAAAVPAGVAVTPQPVVVQPPPQVVTTQVPTFIHNQPVVVQNPGFYTVNGNVSANTSTLPPAHYGGQWYSTSPAGRGRGGYGRIY